MFVYQKIDTHFKIDQVKWVSSSYKKFSFFKLILN